MSVFRVIGEIRHLTRKNGFIWFEFLKPKLEEWSRKEKKICFPLLVHNERIYQFRAAFIHTLQYMQVRSAWSMLCVSGLTTVCHLKDSLNNQHCSTKKTKTLTDSFHHLLQETGHLIAHYLHLHLLVCMSQIKHFLVLFASLPLFWHFSFSTFSWPS